MAPQAKGKKGEWQPGDAPSQALLWAVEGLAKAGTLAVIGVYPEQARVFPIGTAMNKNLTVKMGNCNHRKYIPKLLEVVRSGSFDPSEILSQRAPLGGILEAYKAFDTRQEGWIKVAVEAQSAERDVSPVLHS